MFSLTKRPASVTALSVSVISKHIHSAWARDSSSVRSLSLWMNSPNITYRKEKTTKQIFIVLIRIFDCQQIFAKKKKKKSLVYLKYIFPHLEQVGPMINDMHKHDLHTDSGIN